MISFSVCSFRVFLFCSWITVQVCVEVNNSDSRWNDSSLHLDTNLLNSTYVELNDDETAFNETSTRNISTKFELPSFSKFVLDANGTIVNNSDGNFTDFSVEILQLTSTLSNESLPTTVVVSPFSKLETNESSNGNSVLPSSVSNETNSTVAYSEIFLTLIEVYNETATPVFAQRDNVDVLTSFFPEKVENNSGFVFQTTPIVPIAVSTGFSDRGFNVALTAALITVAILCLVSLCFLYAYRKWRSQLSGEWVLNERSTPHKAEFGGFSNECYDSDNKFGNSVSYNNGDQSFANSKPVYKAGANGSGGGAYLNDKTTRLYDRDGDEYETLEMVQKKFPSSKKDVVDP